MSELIFLRAGENDAETVRALTHAEGLLKEDPLHQLARQATEALL